MNSTRRFTLLLSAASLVLGGLYTTRVSAEKPDMAPDGRRSGTMDHHPLRFTDGDVTGDATGHGGAPVATSNSITYHGGPLLVNGANVYYIWYGNWGTNTAKTILPNVASGLSGTPWFNINTTYYDAASKHVLNAVHLAGQYAWTTTPHGVALSDALVRTIVADTLSGGHLAYDPNGVYFVLTSAEVTETNGAGSPAFCTTFCAFHTHFTWNSTNDVKYAFVGNPSTQCPSTCMAQSKTSPNSNPAADGMANLIAHELSEATSNPDLNAWYDSYGSESADKCAFNFGATSLLSTGAKYNVTLVNGLKVLIQQNWVNAKGGYCALSY